jgi:hypothetical protein
MTTFTKTSEEDIERLAEIMGIPLLHGWKIRMARIFGVDLAVFSHWLKRGLPKKQIEHIVKKGYPVDRWMVKSPPGSIIYPRDTEGRRITVLREADPGRPSHSDVIGQFKNKALARELNEMLLHIEAADPEMLRRDVRRFLQGIITAIESKKKRYGFLILVKG